MDVFQRRVLKEGFLESKKQSQIRATYEARKLTIIGWIASVISFIGIFFNAFQMIICWPIWCVANGFWIYWAWKKNEMSQVVLWVVFTLANIYGWYQWSIM